MEPAEGAWYVHRAPSPGDRTGTKETKEGMLSLGDTARPREGVISEPHCWWELKQGIKMPSSPVLNRDPQSRWQPRRASGGSERGRVPDRQKR